MGSFPWETTFLMMASLTMKLVAQVSSSMRRSFVPASMASMVLAAWEVLPDASSVSNSTVSFPLGRSLMNIEISVWQMALPSSALTFTAVRSDATYSLPSPKIWLYTPDSRAFNNVDLPW